MKYIIYMMKYIIYNIYDKSYIHSTSCILLQARCHILHVNTSYTFLSFKDLLKDNVCTNVYKI